MKSENLYQKKGQVAVVGAIVTLIVGVGVGVLILIFVGALGGQTYNLVEDDIDSIAGDVVNESFTAVNNTAVSLAEGSIDASTFVASNGTAVIGSGNYTLDAAAGEYTLTNANFAGTTYANYTFGDSDIQTSVKNGIKSGFEALEQTGNYMPIIVLAVVIGLVLTIVLGFTAFGAAASGSGSVL